MALTLPSYIDYDTSKWQRQQNLNWLVSDPIKIEDLPTHLQSYFKNSNYLLTTSDKETGVPGLSFTWNPKDQTARFAVFSQKPTGWIGDLVNAGLVVAPTLLTPGLGTALGTALGASGVAASALGNALISGSVAEASGGDFSKGATSGAISSLAPSASSAISEAAGGGLLGAAAGGGLTAAGAAKLQGNDPELAGLIGAVTAAADYTPPAQGMNSPITMAQIESGLGTEGYGTGAQAQASGLFDSNKIGSGAYTQTSYPFDFAELAAADALQMMKSGIGIPAVEQNLIASGIDPLIAADLTQQISLNPSLTSTDLANNLISTYGSNIYDTTIDQVNTAAPKSSQEIPTATSKDINWGALAKGLIGLMSAGAAANIPKNTAPQTTAISAYKPADTMPVYSPEYYQQVQQYYNTYLPSTPRDVATPLQEWYSSGYTQPDSVTAKLFSGV